MGRGLRIGRVAGVEIILDWSLLIIFFLIALSLGAGRLPVWHPDWGAAMTWLVALVAAALLIASVLVHELSHALVGRAQGIDIPRITLFVFGGMAQLEREPDAWRKELWMAIVGPITSFVIGVACLIVAGALTGPLEMDPDDPLAVFAGLGPVATILIWLGPLNILLAIFNLVPGFPLDGGRVLRAALWGATGDIYRATRWASALGRGFGWLLIASGIAMILGVEVPVFGSGAIGGLWIALIGWFLNNAAMLSYRQLLVRRALEAVPVSRVMLADFATVSPETKIAALIDDYLLAREQRTFPVTEGERFVGLVGVEQVHRVPAGQRGERTVKDIMTPAADLATVEPAAAATDALEKLGRQAAGQIPVVQDGKVRGLLRREDIMKWLALHDEGLAMMR